jgi:hypothetical protein
VSSPPLLSEIGLRVSSALIMAHLSLLTLHCTASMRLLTFSI